MEPRGVAAGAAAAASARVPRSGSGSDQGAAAGSGLPPGQTTHRRTRPLPPPAAPLPGQWGTSYAEGGLGEQREVGRGGAGTGHAGFRGRTGPKSWPDPGLLQDPAQRPPGVCSTGRAHLKPRTQAFRAESERQACFPKRETEVQGIGLPAARSHVVPCTRSPCHSANIWKHVWWALGVK